MVEKIENVLDRLFLIGKLKTDTELLINLKIKHLQTRQKIHKISHWKGYYWIFKELLSKRYHQFSNGWKSVVKDVLF